MPPLDVVVDDFNVPQPDMIFIRKERGHIIHEQEQVIMGAPDISVEIISGGSIKRDRVEKKRPVRTVWRSGVLDRGPKQPLGGSISVAGWPV